MTNSTHVVVLAALVTGCAIVSACSSGPGAPSPTTVVTFRVGSEMFRVGLSDQAAIAAARNAQAGGAARIPNGRLAAGADVNVGWSWHLVDVQFSEAAIELCDGRPSDVERGGLAFGGGRYCPWSATIVAIQ
jgi:hypothetical protein